MSASERACKEMKSFETRVAFDVADPTVPFLRSAGGLFVNVNNLAFFYYDRQQL